MKKLFFSLMFVVAVLAIPQLSLATTENTCDLDYDGDRDLTDVALFSQCVSTYDANNDGLHDLTDEALFTSNNQNQTWCNQYMTECMSSTAVDPEDYLNIVQTRITNLSSTSARIWWKASTGSNGYYRYAKSQSELNNLPWRTDNVSDFPDVTGNMYASQVDLINLDTATDYYVQLKKSVGYGSNISYGEVKEITFNTASIDPTDFSSYLKIVEFKATDLLGSYPILSTARVWWRSTIGSVGEYRYSKDMIAIRDLPWRTDGVSNDPSVTGNIFASQVDLASLDDNSTYYVDVRKKLGTQYGEAQSFGFTTGDVGTHVDYLDIVRTNTDLITIDSARIFWYSNGAGDGYFRFSTNQADLVNKPWSSVGVSNDPNVTENFGGSMVSLRLLNPYTKYYVELKKIIGGPGIGGNLYGKPTTINFTTLGGSLMPDPILKVKVCHVVGNGKTNTLEIAESALSAHLAHGDKKGACDIDDIVRPILSINAKLIDRVRGRILLQVQSHGEAWYVNPKDDKRFYLKDGATAYNLMREAGLGITNADLAKIPVGFEDRFNDTDSDSDGLTDKLEQGLGTDQNKADTDGDGVKDRAEILAGTNPLGTGTLSSDNSLANRLKGKIVLQVQSRGEAWYIDPSDGKRYYMRDGEAAYQIMRFRSLGITDSDLSKIAE